MTKLKRKPAAKKPASKKSIIDTAERNVFKEQLKSYNITMGNRVWERFKGDYKFELPEDVTLNLFLLRGIPGSGKSTIAENMKPDYWVESDHYFMKKEGNEWVYRFNADLLGKAHKWCQEQTRLYMESIWAKACRFKGNGEKIHNLVVANTFTTEWEIEPYYKMAEKYEFQVHSLIVENRHGNKDVHNVPKEVIEKMTNRFEIKIGQ